LPLITLPVSGISIEVPGRNYSLPEGVEYGSQKHRILIYSTIMFTKDGYESVSMRDIASAFGLKPSTLYSHFSDKNEILALSLSLAELVINDYFRIVKRAMESAGTYEDTISAALFMPKNIAYKFGCVMTALVSSMVYKNEEARRIYNRWYLENGKRSMAQELARYRPERAEYVSDVILMSGIQALIIEAQRIFGYEPPMTAKQIMTDLEYCLLKEEKSA